MTITQLKNPLTNEYKLLKERVLSQNFDWHWAQSCVPGTSIEIPFLSHVVIERADFSHGKLYPRVSSTFIDICEQILGQFFQYNNIFVDYILRVNINTTFPIVGATRTDAHEDHNYPHKNLIVYLNESDGDTITCNEDEVVTDFSEPEEDKIIIFSGKHYHKLPTKNRRVVMVCTYV